MNSLKEKSDNGRASLPRRRIRDHACMCSTSRRLAYARQPLSFSRLAAKLVCIFLLCVISRIVCVRNLVSLRRRSELSKDINRKAGSEMPEQEFVEAGVRVPTLVGLFGRRETTRLKSVL